MLYPMKADEPRIYKMQVQDRACTICVNVGKGGKICKVCGDERINWVNAFGHQPIPAFITTI